MRTKEDNLAGAQIPGSQQTWLLPSDWASWRQCGEVGTWGGAELEAIVCPAVAMWLQSFLSQNEATQDANRFGALRKAWLLVLLDL